MPIPEHDAWVALPQPGRFGSSLSWALQASPDVPFVTSPVSGHLKHIHLGWSGSQPFRSFGPSPEISAFPAQPLTTTTSADFSLRVTTSPFQA